MKRIEKKHIRRDATIDLGYVTIAAEVTVTAEQVLLAGTPVVKVMVDWNGRPESPEYIATAFVVIEDSEIRYTYARADSPTIPNEDPTTWQDFFGAWEASLDLADVEIEELTVEMQP